MTLTTSAHSKPRLWLELILVFIALPLVCCLTEIPIIAMLLFACLLIGIWLAYDPTFDRSCLRSFPRNKPAWLNMILVWFCLAPFLAALAWFIDPKSLFSLPRQHTGLWLIIMIAYPLVSVVPQEIIYRAFFCHRYKPLFGGETSMAVASAVVFGFAHIVFWNEFAVVLTLAGGWLFARTFLRTKSIPCVAIQHALYGCAIFTVGLGQYFLHGTARLAEMLMKNTGN